jgi:L-malate glycosyltransferase
VNNNKLHILFLASWYPTTNNKLLGNFIQRHAQAIASMCKLTIVSNNKPNSSINNTTELYKKGNGLLAQLMFITQLIRYCKTNNVALVHLNVAYPMGIIALLLKFFCGKKYVITEHWSIYQQEQFVLQSTWFKWVNKLIYKHASYILPVSTQMQTQLQHIAPQGKYTLVSNVVDTSLFKLSPTPYNIATDTFKFMHISTLDEAAKNTTGILYAVQALSKLTLHKFTLHIIAETNYEHLQLLAKQLAISEYIIFEGPLHHTQVATALMQAHSHVLFSNYEGMPCVMIEALACGKPIIGTTVGGMPSIITNKTGLLVTPKNRVALCSAMLLLMNTYNNYDSNYISNYAIQNFSTNAIANKFLDVYKNVHTTTNE